MRRHNGTNLNLEIPKLKKHSKMDKNNYEESEESDTSSDISVKSQAKSLKRAKSKTQLAEEVILLRSDLRKSMVRDYPLTTLTIILTSKYYNCILVLYISRSSSIIYSLNTVSVNDYCLNDPLLSNQAD